MTTANQHSTSLLRPARRLLLLGAHVRDSTAQPLLPLESKPITDWILKEAQAYPLGLLGMDPDVLDGGHRFLCFYLDGCVLQSKLLASPPLHELLAAKQFQTMSGGREFFELLTRISEPRSAPRFRPAIALGLACLELGFQGMYAEDQAERRERYRLAQTVMEGSR